MYENENKQEKHTPPAQKFYFNEEGKLVVETNKGVWVDGEQYAKMYGIFTCNAKTMGIIISRFQGETVVVEEIEDCPKIVDKDNPYLFKYGYYDSVCIVNPTDKDKLILEKNTNLLAEIGHLHEALEACQKQLNLEQDALWKAKRKVDMHNALPWYIRIFKKIKIDEK